MHLNPAQLLGLRYYDGMASFLLVHLNPYTFDLDLDINSRMPRSEAKAIFDLIKPLGKHLD